MNGATAREDVRNALLKYLDTDAIWYSLSSVTIYARSPNLRWISFYQDYPEPLVRLQDDHWKPLLTWARDTFDVELFTSDSVLFGVQPAETRRKLDKVLQGFDPWQMAGCVSLPVLSYHSLKIDMRTAMERVTFTTKSFIIALALVHGRISAEQGALASQVEVASQIERWGEVEDCVFLSLLRVSTEAHFRRLAHDVDYHDVRRHIGSAACLLTSS
jgi:ATP synthase F1 complex assembly factor 2